MKRKKLQTQKYRWGVKTPFINLVLRKRQSILYRRYGLLVPNKVMVYTRGY